MTIYNIFVLVGSEKAQLNQTFHEVNRSLERSARIAMALGFSKVILTNVDDLRIDDHLSYGCMVSCAHNPLIRIFIENLIIENLPEEKPVIDFDKIRTKDFVMSKSLSEENN